MKYAKGHAIVTDFRTFEDVLDLAIQQEKAAQQFYSKLAVEVLDADVQLFYRTLVNEEKKHETQLRQLKRYPYELSEPDLQSLKETGYLDAMPIQPDVTLVEAVRYAIKKEKSARMFYRTLAQMCERDELKQLFNTLADQEQSHTDSFQIKYKDLLEK